MEVGELKATVIENLENAISNGTDYSFFKKRTAYQIVENMKEEGALPDDLKSYAAAYNAIFQWKRNKRETP